MFEIDNMPSLGAYGMAVFLLLCVLRLLFAYGVYREAEKLKSKGEQLLFAGSFLWFLITLLMGLVSVGLFWLIHLSALKNKASH